MTFGGEVLRLSLEDYVDFLGEALLRAEISSDDLDSKKLMLDYSLAMIRESEETLPICLQTIAYAGHTFLPETVLPTRWFPGLANPVIAPEKQIRSLHLEKLQQFISSNLLGPSIVLSATSVDH